MGDSRVQEVLNQQEVLLVEELLLVLFEVLQKLLVELLKVARLFCDKSVQLGNELLQRFHEIHL